MPKRARRDSGNPEDAPRGGGGRDGAIDSSTDSDLESTSIIDESYDNSNDSSDSESVGYTKRARRRIYSDSSRDSENTLTPSGASNDAEVQTLPRRSSRLAQVRGYDEWNLNLCGMRRDINQLFRVLRSAPNPHGSANRLRQLVMDAYLMGYCRHRLDPDVWGHMLQVSGSRAFHIGNTIAKVERQFPTSNAPHVLVPLTAKRYGPQCDGDVSDIDVDTSEESDTSEFTDEASGGFDVEVGCDDEVSSQSYVSPNTETKLGCESDNIDWGTPSQGSQPWLSVVVADTDSSDTAHAYYSSSRGSPKNNDECRKIKFHGLCPYPCGETFLQ
ncbi:regulatory protein ICP22 [Bovine alphaherpesvirus 2]|uniref:Regulatory protein ICP22 n=1 Tax=Bovine alphaherpesvirus 2 TaxID=10295 RepID=A0ABX6WNY9_9ALPH|nr:regulatory protein ICP22 [Bovine alphaherpesvirus 2]QPO25194.1 regulatory protein ICP22 [Bovine alphaherpesvirus 2]